MTNKKAIKFLDQVRKILLADKSWLESTHQPINEAFDMAISALEKQIPKEAMSDYDPVSKPEHYTNTKVECIDAMIDVYGVEAVKSFCLCNAFKYHWRAKDKNGEEDLQKADWYMQKYKELVNM